ncbi:ATP-binding protein [Pseudonocardia sp. TRM90224]|uniref:ATP-binding protein n=1 Tax=Pseudonocardia sp. TRM90224 TaxID=2812678 RepID=UPI001E34F4AA|nr:BTAD domain-containing putative transcriptional regulator [Pseudonocardia sp. TRM90224]
MGIELTLLPRVAFRGQDISGPRRRALLALLATDLRTGCDTARLINELWPDGPPDRPAKALQSLVSRTRTQLGPDVILSTPTGYRLALDEEQVDAAAIAVRAAAAERATRAGDPAAALAQAERGLRLWDGADPADPADPAEPADPVAALRRQRRGTHRSLHRLRALALARLGRCAAALGPLTALVDAHAGDEELLLELLRCEAAELAPSAALRRYDTYRRTLRAELGLDPGVELQALHRQLLDSDRPPIREGVPHEPNQLLGRAADVAAVAELLHTSRVVSIVGTGGLGKTRLAVAACHRSDHRAIYMVPLAAVGPDGDVAREVAAALGLAPAPGEHRADVAGRIVRAIGPGRALLVLDNCEHVTDSVAELVGALVALSPTLQVLTTSRAPLGLTSEAVHDLPGLSIDAAVELFEQRARAVRPGVELRPDPLARLCAHLDGLPLAVELAAARVRTMSVAEIADGMAERRFVLLRGGAKDTPERHQTLAAVVGWSWKLLDATGRQAMRTLSVFPDGFTPAAAGALLGEADAPAVLERLVGQSLLIVTDTPSGTRMRMLETVRQFSASAPHTAPHKAHGVVA